MAKHYKAKSEEGLKSFPEALEEPHSDPSTNLRYAKVYEETARVLHSQLIVHLRNLHRAGNPLFSKHTDQEIDRMHNEFNKEYLEDLLINNTSDN